DGLEEAASSAGARRLRGETVVDFADRLDREGPATFGRRAGPRARAWERALYDPDPEDDGIREAVKGVDDLRARALAGVPVPRRAAAFLDLRRAFRLFPGVSTRGPG
ncbi:MAG TPA: hypothetical protein VLH39_06250, partial [Magnetospirillaceae bacterium]|nr:hypothetical protein [Magnetospirillaceae bacterium]